MPKRKKKMFGSSEKPRLVVYRSIKYIHAQLIDDSQGKVLVGMFNKSKAVGTSLKSAKNKSEASFELGKVFAEEAKKKKIKQVVFDRNGYPYHGRVKAFADGAREGGLEF
ncbi:MAG: 50S ribosomal protein L18 [Calditrichaceae bacterium]|nr:50S ribosomal protein L18 [Calditrichaceae bacterium]MBN2709085.1 50S ribosomal protein L18 [Calditrichaceae bacterium]RQV97042.1 MAG: 50S ribosomal protein L18 [Calditrichota bacterium]